MENIILAQDENVVIESQAKSAGEVIKSETGIIIGKRELPEVPLTGVIISVGSEVPDGLLGKTVLLPPGSAMQNVPDPRFIKGEIKQVESRKMCATHWKNIKVVYDF